MGVAAGKLRNKHSLQTVDFLRNWHKRALIYIERHLSDISKAQLPTRSASETVDLAAVGEDHGVDISARSVDEVIGPHCSDASGNWLVWIAIFICGEA